MSGGLVYVEGECSCIQVSVLREISSCEYEIEFAFALKAALLLLYIHVGALCTFQAGNGYKWASIILRPRSKWQHCCHFR